MGQAVAALGAAAGEYLASIGGSHPLTEAVLFGALALFGLIGTEHLHTPPVQNLLYGEGPYYSTAGGVRSDAAPQLTRKILSFDR